MKCFLFLSFIILLLSAFECPSSTWFRFRNKCYLTETSKQYSFQANVDLCESLNATTVSIHSEEENNFLKSQLTQDYPYWLGIRQVYFNVETYAWLDGSLYNYSNWVWRLGRRRCAGASIYNGKWHDGTNYAYTDYAFCQIDFDSLFYKMQSQINLLIQESKDDRKAEESRLNETNARLDKTLNTTYACITNLNSTFEAKLNEKENRLNKRNDKVEDQNNLLNLSMTFKNSDFELDLKNKHIQVNTINEELARHRLVGNRLEDALNTQNDSIANISSDLRKKEIEIKSTNKELVRLFLMMIKLENAIHTQNDLIQRMRSTFESESAKN